MQVLRNCRRVWSLALALCLIAVEMKRLVHSRRKRPDWASMLGVSIATLYRKMGLKLERDKLLG